jgi:hypothetical protein
MRASFYDTSIGSYLQILDSLTGVLRKGAMHGMEIGRDVDALLDNRLFRDMLPLSFQLRSVIHHSLGAIRGIESGEFAPPPKLDEVSYAGFQARVAEAADALRAYHRDDIDALSTRTLVFSIGDREIPFTAENFLFSFSLPNFYFHATTTYAILRAAGVPLGKQDFLGKMRVGI